MRPTVEREHVEGHEPLAAAGTAPSIPTAPAPVARSSRPSIAPAADDNSNQTRTARGDAPRAVFAESTVVRLNPDLSDRVYRLTDMPLKATERTVNILSKGCPGETRADRQMPVAVHGASVQSLAVITNTDSRFLSN